jgi:hypothetical protein
MSFHKKKWLLMGLGVALVLVLLLLHNILLDSYIGIGIVLFLMIGYLVLNWIWWRCPHCNAYLWKLSTFAEYCPHCGKKLEE